MKTSEAIDQVVSALVAAKLEMPRATFNRVNPHFKSRYADQVAILEAAEPSLTKNGLVLTSATEITEQLGTVCECRIIHGKSGQWIASELPLKATTPQGIGSELTYIKRYLWSGLIAMAADEDDDANSAELGARLSEKSAPPPKPKKTAHAARQDGTDKIYAMLVDGLRQQESLADLHMFWQNHQAEIGTMPDSWLTFLQQEKDRLKESFKPEEDIKTLLERSLAEEQQDDDPEAA